VAKKAKGADGKKADADRHIDMQLAPEFFERIDNLQGDIDNIMSEAKTDCQPLRKDIADIKKEAHNATGIPMEVINSKIAERRARQRADAIRNNLKGDFQDIFDQLSLKLGDLNGTPLGESAKTRELTEEERRTAH